MINEIQYIDTESPDHRLHALAWVYGNMLGFTDAAIKATAHTNQLQSERNSLPYSECGEASSIEYQREIRGAHLECAKAAERAILPQFTLATYYAYEKLLELCATDESSFEDPYLFKLFATNYVAAFNRLRTAFALIEFIRTRSGRIFYPTRDKNKPWPHKTLLYLGAKRYRKEADVYDFYRYASAWMKVLPEWPQGVGDDHAKNKLFFKLMEIISGGSSHASINHHGWSHDELAWLESALKAKGWSVEENRWHAGDADGEYYACQMPKLRFSKRSK